MRFYYRVAPVVVAAFVSLGGGVSSFVLAPASTHLHDVLVAPRHGGRLALLAGERTRTQQQSALFAAQKRGKKNNTAKATAKQATRSGNGNSRRLTAAPAKKLVKAAHVDTTTSTPSLKVVLDPKMNTVNQGISNLRKEVANLRKEIVQQKKTQSLEWAIDHAEINAFKMSNRNTSAGLCREILLDFRMGYACYCLPDDVCLQDDRYSYRYKHGLDDEDARRDNFHEALCEQINALTGVEPRIRMDNDDGDYLIYYS